jgi:hypothetical protein
MDHILFVNSASFVDVSITSSLLVALGSNIDFSQATQVSGAFVGTLEGNATTATTASYALNISPQDTASFALTASIAFNAISSSYADTSISASYASQADSALTAISASHADISDTAISASFASIATTAITAITASYFNLAPRIKSGKISGSLFGGVPLTASVAFATSYPNENYAVSVIGGDARSWTLEQVSSSGFIVSSNSIVTLTDYVYWTSMEIGESV